MARNSSYNWVLIHDNLILNCNSFQDQSLLPPLQGVRWAQQGRSSARTVCGGEGADCLPAAPSFGAAAPGCAWVSVEAHEAAGKGPEF